MKGAVIQFDPCSPPGNPYFSTPNAQILNTYGLLALSLRASFAISTLSFSPNLHSGIPDSKLFIKIWPETLALSTVSVTKNEDVQRVKKVW
jgi:hypothetical protein